MKISHYLLGLLIVLNTTSLCAASACKLTLSGTTESRVRSFIEYQQGSVEQFLKWGIEDSNLFTEGTSKSFKNAFDQLGHIQINRPNDRSYSDWYRSNQLSLSDIETLPIEKRRKIAQHTLEFLKDAYLIDNDAADPEAKTIYSEDDFWKKKSQASISLNLPTKTFDEHRQLLTEILSNYGGPEFLVEALLFVQSRQAEKVRDVSFADGDAAVGKFILGFASGAGLSGLTLFNIFAITTPEILVPSMLASAAVGAVNAFTPSWIKKSRITKKYKKALVDDIRSYQKGNQLVIEKTVKIQTTEIADLKVNPKPNPKFETTKADLAALNPAAITGGNVNEVSQFGEPLVLAMNGLLENFNLNNLQFENGLNKMAKLLTTTSEISKLTQADSMNTIDQLISFRISELREINTNTQIFMDSSAQVGELLSEHIEFLKEHFDPMINQKKDKFSVEIAIAANSRRENLELVKTFLDELRDHSNTLRSRTIKELALTDRILILQKRATVLKTEHSQADLKSAINELLELHQNETNSPLQELIDSSLAESKK